MGKFCDKFEKVLNENGIFAVTSSSMNGNDFEGYHKYIDGKRVKSSIDELYGLARYHADLLGFGISYDTVVKRWNIRISIASFYSMHDYEKAMNKLIELVWGK